MKKKLCICGAVLFVIGLLIFIFTEKPSIGIIGGADGPTAVFIAGKAWIFIFSAILLIAAFCIILIKKKK